MVTLAATTISDHAERIDADGDTIVADAVEPALVDVQCCPRFVRRQQNPYLSIPAAVATTFSDRLLELLGERRYKGITGHGDGRSPGEVVFGERMAETAYRVGRGPRRREPELTRAGQVSFTVGVTPARSRCRRQARGGGARRAPA